MRTIETKGFPNVAPPSSLGKPARLEWIAIKALVIDPEYQREVSGRGRRNIAKIAGEFDWSKFAPVIVAPAGSDRYAIVDGQHRATAAALVGLDRVPCCIIDAARAAQAAAFAAINTVVTAMSPLQVHTAKVAAGDPEAVRLNEVCGRAGVTICRYPIPSNKMTVGQTLAAGMLYKFLARFGEETLEAALSCITKTGDGNPGWVSRPIIEALCAVLDAEPAWRDSPKLIAVMQDFSFADSFARANVNATNRSRTISALVEIVGEHLEKRLSPFNAASVPAPAPKAVALPPPSKSPAPLNVKSPDLPSATATPQVIDLQGIMIVQTEGREAITYRGRTKTVSPRQAKLFELLARGMPNPIGRDFLRQKLFGVIKNAQHDVQLDLVASEARLVAKAVSLDIRETRGIGFSLVKS